MSDSKIPIATYRFQLTGTLGFARARELVPYLAALGIDTLYASPILVARRDSTANYDVCDPRFLDPRLGSDEDFDALAAALREREMGMVVDIVPNHMAASTENPWWREVLAHGPDSAAARIFDIDWDAWPAAAGAAPKLLLPILGGPYAEVLARGELTIADSEGGLAARYFDTFLPLAPGSCPAEHGDDPAAIHEILEAQHYRLGFWRSGARRINYRRFFDISELAGTRVEDGDVFAALHEKTLALVSRGAITGLRVDHIDGLRDPTQYLQRLERAASDAADGRKPYIVVEKILSHDETMPADWPIQGTTGYEFVRALNGVFVDADGLAELERIYEKFLGFAQPFEDRLYQQKKRVIRDLFPNEIHRRSAELRRLALADLHARDLYDYDLDAALVEVAACFPVYRSYAGTTASEQDRRWNDSAVAAAQERAPHVAAGAFDFLRRVLSMEGFEQAPADMRQPWADFVCRWQQLTGPIVAKGLEDTALYQDFRLLSLNSVGGEPDAGRELMQVEAFHRHNQYYCQHWPHSMISTSTHDSKRSEDVRARLHVLSDMPVAWSRALSRWAGQNGRHKQMVAGRAVPSRNVEVLIYQTMLGAWPLDQSEVGAFIERLEAYLIKASREAKLETSWLDTNEEYEGALIGFVRAITDDAELMRDFASLQQRIAFYGAINGLSQVILKATSPGVPDFYQGTELWTFTLVDPDNRRAVDFDRRQRLLQELNGLAERDPVTTCRELLRTWQDGRIKLFVTQRALAARGRHSALFTKGDYLPLRATGERADDVCVFARRHEASWTITAVPMRVGKLGAAGAWPTGKRCWKNTILEIPAEAPKRWRNAFTGELIDASGELRAAEVFKTLPIALLEPA